MARVAFNTDQQDQTIWQTYVEKKKQYDQLDKELKQLGDTIKELMKQNDQKSVEVDGYKINRITSQRMKWDENALLHKVKSYNMPELVKTVEQVDMTELEKCILDNVVKIKDLEECYVTIDVVQLRLNKIKEVQDE